MVRSIARSPLALFGSGSVLCSQHLQLLCLWCHLLLDTLDWKSVSRYQCVVLAVLKLPSSDQLQENDTDLARLLLKAFRHNVLATMRSRSWLITAGSHFSFLQAFWVLEPRPEESVAKTSFFRMYFSASSRTSRHPFTKMGRSLACFSVTSIPERLFAMSSRVR